ncbi:endonuclease/exonuclease/phosphatase family protein [Evansella sp. AB-P1]|uniref:endonuclease/exonuclease/phosphatase family protein n=1 Tax=Evansella sp. AB-P1 TaxID=3037653 RepID=UPI00241CE6AC|nr:endonuclease/exonuclease/phosphatase family protein [Evansella sp. AB-P1]MDG5786067.1 endonuclease/exonuclease/phosphatase family protein [Evansella sp. AB-P1]
MSKNLMVCIRICFLLGIIIYLYHHEHKREFVFANTTGNEKFELGTENTFTVATYNIQFGRGQDGVVDIDRTINKLKMLDADIISLQEVERNSLRSSFNDQVTTIAKALEMEAYFYPSLAYPGLYYGNVILSRFPISESTTIPFNNKVEDRSAIFSKIQLSEESFIYVVNTHLGLNNGERQLAIEKIHEKLLTIKYPVLVTGDLNSTPSQKEYNLWNELLIKSNEGMEITTFYKHNWQIDYIFHSEGLERYDIQVYESKVSDHYPLVGTFQLLEDN